MQTPAPTSSSTSPLHLDNYIGGTYPYYLSQYLGAPAWGFREPGGWGAKQPGSWEQGGAMSREQGAEKLVREQGAEEKVYGAEEKV